MKFSTATKNDTAVIPEVPRTEVRILWVNDFYDVPLQGMADVHGTRCLFDIIDRNALGTDEESHTYWLIALSAEQVQEEERWHDLFCRKVGTHFDFTGRPTPAREQLCPEEFYEPYRQRTPPDYSSSEVIAWFRL